MGRPFLIFNLPFKHLFSGRTDTDHFNGAAAEFFQVGNIILAGLGKFIKALAGGNIAGKAFDFLINRFCAFQLVDVARILGEHGTIRFFVGDADLQGVKATQGVKLIDRKTIQAVYTDCMADKHGIKPAGTPRPVVVPNS